MQKTAYEVRISDWSSDVCSSDLRGIVTWSPLGGGMLTGKYRKGEKGRAEGFGGNVFQAENSAQRTATLDTVIAVADELGVSPDQVAIAWAGTQDRKSTRLNSSH